MKIFSHKIHLIKFLKTLNDSSIGLVPTMGALHEGHLSLVRKALTDNDFIVVSIFVNPTQFNNKEDLIKYPRTVNRDLALLETVSKSKIIVYSPTVEDVYDNSVNSDDFDFGGLENEMEGAFRPGHFNGVGTIVKRLLEIVNPDKAYFGEKDFQQLQIIKKLVESFKMSAQIIGVPIYRHKDGLAMSSRNERLTPEYRKAAPFIYKTLQDARLKFGTKSVNKLTEWVKKEFENHELLELEYFTIASETTLKPVKRKSKNKSYRAFISVYAEDVRLIDNIALN